LGGILASRNIQAIHEGANMPLGDNLVKRPIDDEEYANACPTIGTLMLAHFSTPTKHNTIVYGADGLFFSTYPSRRMYLRPAFRGEFDIYTSEQDYERRPMLWVLVSQSAPGYHEITPRWRGHAFWGGMEADQAVAEVVMQMSERSGLSLAEWYGFISDQRIRKTDAANNRSKMVN
jgi:hypothetical protein